MKKSLLAVLLIVVMFAPVFAFESELVPKVGYLINPNMKFKVDGYGDFDFNKDTTFSLNLDYFVKFADTNLFVGLGTMWTNGHKFSNKDIWKDDKISYLNLYFTSKYKFDVSTKDVPMNIYPIIQIGYGISLSDLSNYNYKDGEYLYSFKDKTVKNGLYGSIGCGFEIKSFIIETLYGCNFGKYNYTETKEDTYDPSYNNVWHLSHDILYTSFRINIGYKFSL